MTAQNASDFDDDDQKIIVGIDLGGTHYQVGLVNSANQLVGRSSGLTSAEDGGGKAVVDRLADGVRAACENAGTPLDQVRAIGIGTPSPIDPTFRIAIHAVNLKWHDFPLADRMTDKLGGSINVTLDNDVNCAVWGEHILGAGRDSSSLLGLWIGTGIGGGLVLDGQLYHGPCGTAGEIGQAVLFPNDPHSTWRYEDTASRKSIVDRVLERIRSGAKCILALTDQTSDVEANQLRITSSDLARAVKAGDETVCEVVRSSARATGIMCANAVTLLSLDCIVIGGGIAEELGETYIEWMREIFDAAVFPQTLRSCRINATQLRENAGLLGAAFLARERFT